MALKFEWNEKKAHVNLKKHGVTFEEARTVFSDPLARISEDSTHSQDEQGCHIIGMSDQYRVIVVAYTERPDRIRIITARTAEPSEKKRYEKIRLNQK